MYKIAILGCENSHANIFLNYILKDKKYEDIEVVGVYSDDSDAAEKLHEEYGVYVAKSFDEFVGKVDGIAVTARHGDNHYKFAKPYIKYGISVFVDKPVTVSESDAIEFANELKSYNSKVCGGWVCGFAKEVQKMKQLVKNKEQGEVYGGYLRDIIDLDNDYGGVYFYAQHLVQIMSEIFGYYPNSVKAFENNKIITCVVRYDEYDVNLEYVDGNYITNLTVSCEKLVVSTPYSLDGCFEEEFELFYKILKGEEQHKSYEDFIAPVFVINAISRSLESGNEEVVRRF